MHFRTRNGDNSTWNSWSEYWHSNSTGLEGDNRITTISNFNNTLPSGFYQSSNASNMPASSWHNMINVRHNNTCNDH